MLNRYLEKTEYVTDRMPSEAEEGVLYVVSVDAFLREPDYPDIPYALYRDVNRDGDVFAEGVKYVLEGEGEFDPEEFDDDYLSADFAGINVLDSTEDYPRERFEV